MFRHLFKCSPRNSQVCWPYTRIGSVVTSVLDKDKNLIYRTGNINRGRHMRCGVLNDVILYVDGPRFLTMKFDCPPLAAIINLERPLLYAFEFDPEKRVGLMILPDIKDYPAFGHAIPRVVLQIA